MTFKDYSINSRRLIEENLINFLNDTKKEEIPDTFKKQEVITTLTEFVTKGKLIRGTLFLLSLEMLDIEISKEHIDIACAIELVHSALLIQDDVIDNDKTRRGGKTVFATYEQRGEEIKAIDPRHYGISIAIVAADVAIFLAVELLSHYKGRATKELLAFYAHEIYHVATAQGIDSEFGQSEVEPTKEDIYAVYKYKTARYTFSLPFVMAGIVAGNKNVSKQLEELGEIAGLIFQIKDDYIGLLGDEEVIGKPVGSDIRENKKTVIRALLYEFASNAEKGILDSSFGNQNLLQEEISKIKKLVEKYKISTIINNEIIEIMQKGWKIFESLDVNKKYKAVLKDLLEFNLNRTA